MVAKDPAIFFTILDFRLPDNYKYVHQIAMNCLKESKSPYGFFNSTYQPLKSREKKYEKISQYVNRYLNKEYKKVCYIGYCGPWIEDWWKIYFQNKTLDEFGPFIPVFFPWTHVWRNYHLKVYRHIIKKLFSMMDLPFLFITVTQNDDGIEGKNNWTRIPPNLFVLSSGGKGHIPLLLFKSVYQPIQAKEYIYDACFLGKQKNHKGVRGTLIGNFSKAFGPRFYSGLRSDWVEVYRQSKVILAPRGYGRNSFRLTEILQLGLIPVVIYDDILWLAYLNSSLPWDKMIFISRTNSYQEAINEIKHVSNSELEERRRLIKSFRNTHFTYEGTMTQIEMFLLGGYAKSDLRCSRYLPNH